LIAVDTNVLVAAHREEHPAHDRALTAVTELVRREWGLPWPCVHEFLGVVTNRRLFPVRTPLPTALAMIDGLCGLPTCHLLGEGESHLRRLAEIATLLDAAGGRIHDARIAAICLAHGVRELWTADRLFLRVSGLRVRNPLDERFVP
jgi:uncharacterized protein